MDSCRALRSSEAVTTKGAFCERQWQGQECFTLSDQIGDCEVREGLVAHTTQGKFTAACQLFVVAAP